MSICKLLHADQNDLKKIRGVCFDIDDTLSTKGKLTANAFDALWKLKEGDFTLVAVTGRPSGWCDHIARFWPVDAVIGENGAFIFYMGEGKRKRLDVLGEVESSKVQKKLIDFKNEVLEEFPNARWASDQNYREYDLAVDICEDVPTWKEDEIERLLTFCKKRKAKAKLSSIHVNIWFGDYDKQKALSYWLKNGTPGAKERNLLFEDLIYIGDSPNDAPAFDFFKYSVGVANLKKYLSKLKHHPTWITEKESGEGFQELAESLLKVK